MRDHLQQTMLPEKMGRFQFSEKPPTANLKVVLPIKGGLVLPNQFVELFKHQS